MAKFRGTVHKSDLEGGHWQLRADDGETYVLEAEAALVDGQRVEIDGAIDRNLMGFAMTGPILKVRSAKAV